MNIAPTSAAPSTPGPDARPPRADASSERLAFVDLLRGIAILGVVAVHSRYYWFAGIPPLLRSVAHLGRYGVDLFFIVSAFTLARSCRNRPVREFVVRRWLRIAPVYYLGILIYAVLPWLLGSIPAPNLGLMLTNLTFLNGWWPGQTSTMVPGGWSISAEIAFYCVLPWVAKRVTSLRRAVLAYGVVLLGSQLVGRGLTNLLIARSLERWDLNDFQEYCPIWHLPTFALGLMLYFAHPLVRPARRWLLIAVGVAGILAVPYSIDRWQLPRSLAAGVPLFAFALGVSISTGELRSIPVQVLRWLGTVSYGVYLVHFWVLEVVVVLIVATMVPRDASGLTMLAMTFLGTLVLSAGLAALSRRYIEEPALRLASRICPSASAKRSMQKRSANHEIC